ncbi:MAG: TAXI family TRAP transporter solute-binding subunit [Mariniblastus sp.]|nr:TAXI family TRAP transporter solute-binding subunit [Mariniblastus sp.]
MDLKKSPGDTSNVNDRKSKLRFFLGGLFIAVIAFAGLFAWYLFSPTKHELVFSSGSESGLYNQLALAVESVVEEFHPDIDIVVQSSDGSNQNLERIDSRTTDLGLVQNDSVGGENARSLAGLYPEVLHLIARRDADVAALDDLNGLRINVGANGSGTKQVVEALLDFASVQPMEMTNFSFAEAATCLNNGSIEAGFFLTGIPGQFMEDLLNSPELELIPLIPKAIDHADVPLASERFINGFQTSYPFVSVQTIPMMSYQGLPEFPIPTLGISAVLVARNDLPDGVVQTITKTLFERRVDLTNEVSVFAKLDEASSSSNLRFPLHEGADAFYRRSEPGFLTRHAESMGFILTVMLLGWSCLAAGKNLFVRERKDRVDTYYAAVDEIMGALEDDIEPQQATELEVKLLSVDHEIRQDLINEKIKADNAFLIYQNMYNACYAMLRDRKMD